ncbi:MAG: hypothetical protein QOG78_4441, partial [Rhodospirillaceae bacterium]|nr:hypothetical protein [Rhodospirillaceae bacterium]
SSITRKPQYGTPDVRIMLRPIQTNNELEVEL